MSYKEEQKQDHIQMVEYSLDEPCEHCEDFPDKECTYCGGTGKN